MGKDAPNASLEKAIAKRMKKEGITFNEAVQDKNAEIERKLDRSLKSATRNR